MRRTLTRIIGLGAALAVLGPAIGAAADEGPRVTGLFCLMPYRQPTPVRLGSNGDLMSVMTFYFFWRDIEPQRGQYAWEKIDAALEAAARLGKRVSLGVAPGIGTPAWVYEAGVRGFRYSGQPRKGREVTPEEM